MSVSSAPWRIAATAFSLLALACGTKDPVDPVVTVTRTSAAGESCARTADCDASLVCLANVCSTAGTTQPLEDGGVVVVPPPGPRLSARGESCINSGDCASGLACRPSPSFSTGVCDVTDFGFQPTGKTCSGECNSAADCCELPVGYLGHASCEALGKTILDALGGTTVAAACTNPSTQDANCFAYATYCACGSNTWACTSNRCVYAAACQFSGITTKGCADTSRTGVALVSHCDTAASKCQPSPVMAQCTNPTQCETLPIVDVPTATCHAGECTCYQSSCYRKCTKELDCAQGYTCDMTNSVCTPQGACSTNEYCADRFHNLNYECRQNACVLTCKSNFDCSGTGTTSGAFNDSICNSAGVCENLGCSSDNECAAASGVKMFCVTRPTGTATGGARSAITDGR